MTTERVYYSFNGIDSLRQDLNMFNLEYYMLSNAMKYFEKKVLILNMEHNLSKGNFNDKFLIKSMKKDLDNSIGKKAFEF